MTRSRWATFVTILFAIGVTNAQEPTVQADGRPRTARQQAHSRLYPQYDGRAPLLGSSGNTRVRIEDRGIEKFVSLPEFLSAPACAADAIVLATVRSFEAALTESKKFIFTDYDVTVDDVLKGDTALLYAGSQIVVTRPGGELVIEGRRLRADDRSFRPLSVGNRYLLFLNFLPVTQSFITKQDIGFAISAKGVSSLTNRPIAVAELSNIDWQAIRASAALAASGPCE